jgi:hypothetical protein
VRSRYSGKPRQQALFSAELEPSAGPNAPVTVRQGLARVQFPNQDGSRLVAVGPNVLSVHMLRPYTGWDEEFRGQIEDAIAAFATTVGDAVKLPRFGGSCAILMIGGRDRSAGMRVISRRPRSAHAGGADRIWRGRTSSA